MWALRADVATPRADSALAQRLGEFLRLDLKEPLRGSLMIQEGGMMTPA